MNVSIDLSEKEVKTAVLEFVKGRYDITLVYDTLSLGYDGNAITANGSIIHKTTQNKIVHGSDL